MTFGGYNLFVARVESIAPEWREGANDDTGGTQINYMPDKSHVIIIIIINTQGQIVQIYFIWKDCLTRNHAAGCKFHLQPVLCRLAREKKHFREGS